MNKNDVKPGLRVKVICLGNTTGMLIDKKYLDNRTVGITGVIGGYVPGHGGDVWWLNQDNGNIGAYLFNEFEIWEDMVMNKGEAQFENRRLNANITTAQKEKFHQANFGITAHRDILEGGRPGKVNRYINIAGIRFSISGDSYNSIISEIQRLGLFKERDKTELNPKEHAEFLGLIKDMGEIKEAVNELIEERKRDS